MATPVRALDELRSSHEYRPGDFVISNDSLFFELDPHNSKLPEVKNKIKVLDYMNLHPFIFKEKYGFDKPDETIIDWSNKVYLLIDYNKRSQKWRVFECPEFLSGQDPETVDINSWKHLPEENILTWVEPIIVEHPIWKWWLIEDLVQDPVSINNYQIELKDTAEWDKRSAAWKSPSLKSGRPKTELDFLFNTAKVVGDEEVTLIPLGNVFDINAEKLIKKYAPGFLIKVEKNSYKYDEDSGNSFNNEKYKDVETYTDGKFNYYYADIRHYNLQFKLLDNEDPYCIFLHSLESQ